MEAERAAKRPKTSDGSALTPGTAKASSPAVSPPVLAPRNQVAVRTTCEYLDTVDRKVLDFDFEKNCSVCLSRHNVYGCLVCGKYFQGRGKNSHAYVHALEIGHHVFINLDTTKIYCLPDNYEIQDPSLDDIKYNLRPTFTAGEVKVMGKELRYCRSLDDKDFLQGFVGLNKIQTTDWLNVIVQTLVHIAPIRDFFMMEENYHQPVQSQNPLVYTFGELVRKVWNPKNFKNHVSPHELLQAVSVASDKKFRIGEKADPVKFLSWLLNQLHIGLGGSRKKNSSVIFRTFQGELKIDKQDVVEDPDEIKAKKKKEKEERERRGLPEKEEEKKFNGSTVNQPFLFLSLALPPTPLFKDARKDNIIPQIPLFNLLSKFDGQKLEILPDGSTRLYNITRLPRFLILHIKRFTDNYFFTEKNPTIVNFPIRNLEMKPYVSPSVLGSTKYDLLANVFVGLDNVYKMHVRNKANDQWYEMEDLHVTEVIPQLVAVSESYILVYEQQPLSAQQLAELRQQEHAMREEKHKRKAEKKKNADMQAKRLIQESSVNTALPMSEAERQQMLMEQAQAANQQQQQTQQQQQQQQGGGNANGASAAPVAATGKAESDDMMVDEEGEDKTSQ